MSATTVTVNGTVYDKRTGLPLRLERSEIHSKSAQHVHSSVQKSKTLNRRYVKRDTVDTPTVTTIASPPHHKISTHHSAVTANTTTKAAGISHFTSTAATPHPHKISDIAPTPHPLAAHAARQLAKPTTHTTVKPSQVLKQEAITKALAQAPAKKDKREVVPVRASKTHRRLGLVSASVAILLLGGYFTYLSMPVISTRVAAAQAGIDANYPGYQPNGYSLSGPVAYQQGKVTMTFAANAGPASYTLDQVKSGWDSSAVLDSYVKPNAGNDYETTTSNGLTIYTYGTHAAWVNRGIFYTISGNAPLSDDQIHHIATSL